MACLFIIGGSGVFLYSLQGFSEYLYDNYFVKVPGIKVKNSYSYKYRFHHYRTVNPMLSSSAYADFPIGAAIYLMIVFLAGGSSIGIGCMLLFGKYIYLDGVLIKDDYIKFVYKKNSKIIEINKISKEDIQKFDLFLSVENTKTKDSIDITYMADIEILLRDGSILKPSDAKTCKAMTKGLTPYSKIEDELLIKKILSSQDEIPNFRIKTNAKSSFEQELLNKLCNAKTSPT